MIISLKLFLLKSAVFPLIFSIFTFWTAVCVSFAVLILYRYVIGLIYGVIPMPAMDIATFLGLPQTNAHIMSTLKIEQVPADKVRERFIALMKQLPKMRYKIVEIMGDFYYEQMSIEEAISHTFKKIGQEESFKNMKEIDKHVAATINTRFALGRPQYQIYWQDHFEDEKHSLMLWKQHHSWCDGASVISFIMAPTDTYDPSALLHIRHVPLWKRILLRLSVPFNMFKVFKNYMQIRIKKNPLHDGQKRFTGNKVAASSNELCLSTMKEVTKQRGTTINDFMTACLATSVKQYFETKGDTLTDQVKIVIPANIRFSHYDSIKELKLENKFAGVPLKIPLHKDINQSLNEIHKTTEYLRTAFGEVYATLYIYSSVKV